MDYKLLPPQPATFSRYLRQCDSSLELGSILGHGSTAYVYEVKNAAGETLAVKIVDPDQVDGMGMSQDDYLSLRRRLEACAKKEIASMGELNTCEYVMPLEAYYVVKEPGFGKNKYLLFMPKMTRVTKYIVDHHITEAELITMLRHIATVLSYCEDHKLYHRDVKPDNIFLTIVNGKKRFYLSDFGVAMRIGHPGTIPLGTAGTPGYRSPEAMTRGYCPRYVNSDIYSLGAAVYNMVEKKTLKERFVGEPSEELSESCRLSSGLKTILNKMLKTDPEERYHSPKDLLKALDLLDVQQFKRKNHAIAIPKQYAADIRECILARNYEQARKIAEEGLKKAPQDSDDWLACLKYYAYCIQFQDPAQSRRILEEHHYLSDPGCIALLAFICLKQRDIEACLNYVTDAAEDGSVPAMHLYAKCVLGGHSYGSEEENQKAMDMLIYAAESGYSPAYSTLSYYHRETPIPTVSPELERRMEQMERLSDEERKEKRWYDIIRCL